MTDLEAARRALGEGPAAARRALQRTRLLHRVATPTRRRRLWATGGAALATVAAVLALVLLPQPGDTVRAGEQLVAGSEPRVVQFAHGSVVTLGPGAQAQVEVLDETTVEVVLTAGRLDAEVAKQAGRTWRYHAGPWVVRVVGTKLSVQWDLASQALEVGVTNGVVEVSGAGEPPVLVRAGEVLRRGAPSSQVAERQPAPLAKPLAPELPAPPSMPARVGTLTGRTKAQQALSTAPAVVTPNEPSWKALLTAGQRRAAVERAETEGIFARPNLLSDDDALLLADAARLEQRGATARPLLTLVLERGGADAAEASFLMGRLEADAHTPDAARGFFAQAIALAPSGPFAEQARGRLLEVLLDLQDLPAAKAAARDYLANHPAGAWANLAKKLEATR